MKEKLLKDYTDEAGITFVGAEGLSQDKAIKMLNVKNTGWGVFAESAYLSHIFGERNVDWKKGIQAVAHDNGKHYDIIDVELKDGDKLTIYFDITSWYGKLSK